MEFPSKVMKHPSHRLRKSKSTNHKKTSIRSPIVVDTSYASEVDDESEVTLLSHSVPKENFQVSERKPSKAI